MAVKRPPRPVSPQEAMLNTRRALLADPLSLQVQTWLRPIYLRPPKAFDEALAKTTMGAMVSALEPALKSNATLGAALTSVSQFISTPLGSQYQTAYTSIKRPTSGLLGTVVSVVYARALLLIGTAAPSGAANIADLKNILSNPAPYLTKYHAAQASLDPDFIGHLASHAEIEAQVDPHFSTVMDRASALFLETHRPAGDTRNPIADPKAGLDQLASKDPTAWWQHPAGLAIAKTLLPQ
jgi:hypothetical protein